MTCIYQALLSNQGITWCELKKDCFPHCEQCDARKEPPQYTMTCTKLPRNSARDLVWPQKQIPFVPGDYYDADRRK